MTTDAVLDRDGNEVPEGILDAIMTALGSLADLRGDSELANSRTGSMYVVKPKMHGPDEVAFAVELFGRVEELLGLPRLTIKVGIMDEERRTTLNLKACIAEARERVAFINTGFLDRTGDEIHTSMQAGPMVRKNDMKGETWIQAYEDLNVDIGLECGLLGRAQIGKGMWAAPDSLAAMFEAKIGHPQAGASCAWVPSPTAATRARAALPPGRRARPPGGARRAAAAAATARSCCRSRSATRTTGPRTTAGTRSRTTCRACSATSSAGSTPASGCSKVPDITGEPLMEDRATCRISSQHVANWLHHGVVSAEQVEETLRRMAGVVDEQNARRRLLHADGAGLRRRGLRRPPARWCFEGLEQPSGYTEPILHRRRGREEGRRRDRGEPRVSTHDRPGDRPHDHRRRPRPRPRRPGFKPMTVVVLDAGGHVVAVEREDGSSMKRFEIGFGKAHGALSLGMGSRSIMGRAEQQPYFIAAVTSAVGGALVPVPGGVLVRDADGAPARRRRRHRRHLGQRRGGGGGRHRGRRPHRPGRLSVRRTMRSTAMPARGAPHRPRVAGIAAVTARARELLPDRAVITDRARLRTYECDGLAHYRVTPALVVIPEDAAPAGGRRARLRRAPGAVRRPRLGHRAVRRRAAARRRRPDRHLADARDHVDVRREDQRAVVEPGVINLDVTRGRDRRTATTTRPTRRASRSARSAATSRRTPAARTA